MFASSRFWGAFCVFGPACLLVGPCWFSCHGLEVLTSSCVWHASFGIGMECATRCARSLWCVSFILGFVAWLCSLVALSRITVGFLLVFRFVVGYTLLCSFAGRRCWAPAPGAAALAGLLRFASVYCCFCVLASSWCLLLVFPPRSGGVDLILRLARKPWH